ncbi:hypothetical protein BC830DRAFT_1125754 [Chytriomyces sp. MP71]|nr:hypothetical protein BC830DRAFT_1125754 [Chytriomyces sp. MP71]
MLFDATNEQKAVDRSPVPSLTFLPPKMKAFQLLVLALALLLPPVIAHNARDNQAVANAPHHPVANFAHYLKEAQAASAGQDHSVPHLAQFLKAAGELPDPKQTVQDAETGERTVETVTGDVRNATGVANATISSLSQAAQGQVALTPLTGSVAGALLLVGVVFLFAGNLVFKPILGLAGFLTFAGLGYWATSAIDASRDPHLAVWIYIVVCLAAGLLGAGLLIWLWHLGLFLIGALLGLSIGFLVEFACQTFWQDKTSKIIVLVALAVLGGIAIYFMEKPILVLATSVCGSYLVLFAVDIFGAFGFTHQMMSLIKGSSDVETLTGNPRWIGMLVGCVLLALLGIGVQAWQIRQHGHHKGLKHRDNLQEDANGGKYMPHVPYSKLDGA